MVETGCRLVGRIFNNRANWNKALRIVKIPQVRIAKINISHTVSIKLDDYSYCEYQMLEVVLKEMSTTPDRDGFYLEYIFLPNRIIGRYSRRLVYKNELRGTAGITIVDRVLVERFLFAIRNRGY